MNPDLTVPARPMALIALAPEPAATLPSRPRRTEQEVASHVARPGRIQSAGDR